MEGLGERTIIIMGNWEGTTWNRISTVAVNAAERPFPFEIVAPMRPSAGAHTWSPLHTHQIPNWTLSTNVLLQSTDASRARSSMPSRRFTMYVLVVFQASAAWHLAKAAPPLVLHTLESAKEGPGARPPGGQIMTDYLFLSFPSHFDEIDVAALVRSHVVASDERDGSYWTFILPFRRRHR